jgi:hypothetical protein
MTGAIRRLILKSGFIRELALITFSRNIKIVAFLPKNVHSWNIVKSEDLRKQSALRYYFPLLDNQDPALYMGAFSMVDGGMSRQDLNYASK